MLEHPDIVFLDCYAHQVFSLMYPHVSILISRWSRSTLFVGDYIKSEVEALTSANQASDLITWLRSKTLSSD